MFLLRRSVCFPPRLTFQSCSANFSKSVSVNICNTQKEIAICTDSRSNDAFEGKISSRKKLYSIRFFSTSRDTLEVSDKLAEGISDGEANMKPEDYGLCLSEKDVEEITGGDPELIKKVNYIQLEHELYRQEGGMVPSKIKMGRWAELLRLQSKSQRKKYYEFLFKIEMKQINERKKKLEAQALRMQQKDPVHPKVNDVYGTTYGLGMNTIYHRVYDTTIAKFYHNKMIQAMKFDPPIIFDLGYDEHMTAREAKNCAKQLELTITENKVHPQPFNLTLCNAHRDTQVMQQLLKIIPTLYSNDYALNVTEKSYLDLFPIDNIVYLSPHAKEDLKEYDEDEIYIIGAMVDKADPRPLSLAKAKKENLRMKRLPLDKYLDWGLGGKSLTLDQMNNIMLDARYTKDWHKALRFVPRRKLRNYGPDENQESRQFRGRHERQSPVLEDYDLLNKRRGFNPSDRTKESDNYNFRKSNYNNNNFSQPRMRSILRDDD